MLASLDHPNIVKLHGRACGSDFGTNSLHLSDGYFILIDRLTDTLDDRIDRWMKKNTPLSRSSKGQPSLVQVNTACSIADALSYLHSKKVVFCDLKPANIGFDSTGALKLFDFGFATCINPDQESPSVTCSEASYLIYDKCGTMRYMAPEVGLRLGYSLPADVYSFGILLWQIFRLKKPFNHIKSAKQFQKEVFQSGGRPKLSKQWPQVLKDTISSCWAGLPNERPTMEFVKKILHAHLHDVCLHQDSSNQSKSFRNSLMLQRFKGW